VEVIISNVPGCTDSVPEYFILESLYNAYITLFGATPELDFPEDIIIYFFDKFLLAHETTSLLFLRIF
jgi:hypothetical protein